MTFVCGRGQRDQSHRPPNQRVHGSSPCARTNRPPTSYDCGPVRPLPGRLRDAACGLSCRMGPRASTVIGGRAPWDVIFRDDTPSAPRPPCGRASGLPRVWIHKASRRCCALRAIAGRRIGQEQNKCALSGSILSHLGQISPPPERLEVGKKRAFFAALTRASQSLTSAGCEFPRPPIPVRIGDKSGRDEERRSSGGGYQPS